MEALYKDKRVRFAVAPMMDWTDRHCRYFHRQLTKSALLYTEMVTADAVIHGDRRRLLGFHGEEHPLALQLGGSEPEKLAEAASIAVDFGYDEINLNVGCPSNRVQNGAFGACLMREPELVGKLVAAIKKSVSCPVTVKCRIGVDDQDEEEALNILTDSVLEAGVDALWVHARKAWLQGLSPKENRDVPPLNYERVYRLKQKNPDLFIGINGGIDDLSKAREHLKYMDGVMLGRASYHQAALLRDVDAMFYDQEKQNFDWQVLCNKMIVYCEEEMNNKTSLSAITRHMIGLFHGVSGARRYRQILSEEARLEGAKPEIINKAFKAVIPYMEKQEPVRKIG